MAWIDIVYRAVEFSLLWNALSTICSGHQLTNAKTRVFQFIRVAENALKTITVAFRLASVAQKCLCFSSLMLQRKRRGEIKKKKQDKVLRRIKIHPFIVSKSRHLRPYLQHRMRQREIKLKFFYWKGLLT